MFEFICVVAIVVGVFVFRHIKKETPHVVHREQVPPKPTPKPQSRYYAAPKPAPFNEKTARDAAEKPIIRGNAYVIDGDTVVISKTQIRLFGVDAPEINHPHGKKAKWALVSLCKGQSIRAEVTDVDAHGRTVARCYLPDGRDLSAEMVKQGLAIDWPKFSGGKYRSMEVPNVRKKLWLADARQKGHMHVWQQFENRQKARKASASSSGPTPEA